MSSNGKSVLVITEKGSQKDKLCEFLKCKRSRDQKRVSLATYEGYEITIFPLRGHILEIQDVTSRNEPIENLPIMPTAGKIMERIRPVVKDSYGEKEKKDAKDRADIYDAFKKLVETKKFDRIILATDPDIEGCAIGVEVIDKFKLSGVETNMMNISNVNIKKLKQEFNKALFDKKDAVNFRAWAQVAHIRADINNRTGIDVSHYFSKKFSSFITFGSQQTRALKLIVDRWKAHKSADRSDHFRIRITTNIGDFLVKTDEDKTNDEEYVRSIYDELVSMSDFEVSSVLIKKTVKKSPAWMDGSDIGAIVAKQLKKHPKQITSKDGGVLQKLYEAGKMTYPRGEAMGVMPLSQYEEQVEIALAIADRYEADRLDTSLKKPYLWRRDDEEVDGEIINHTPCTIATPDIDFSSLSTDEKAVIDVSAKVLLSCFYPDNKVKNYTVSGKYGEIEFVHQSSEDVDMGWKELYGNTPRVSPVPENIVEGYKVEVDEINVEKYNKEPPPLFTEVSLLSALKKKKIGAESTFTSLVDKVLSKERGYCEVKNGKIVPTEKGLLFLSIVPQKAIDVLSIFESVVAKKLQDGKMPLEKALNGRDKIIRDTYELIVSNVENEKALAEKLSMEAKKTGGFGEEIGSCPQCDGDGIIMDFGKKWKQYVCTNRPPKGTPDEEKDKYCNFVIYKEFGLGNSESKVSYKISPSTAKNLLSRGEAVVEVTWKESGNTGEKTLFLDRDKKPPRVLMDWGNNGK